MVSHELAGTAGPLALAPHNLNPEIALTEHAIHERFQVMAHGRIAVERDAARGLEHAMAFQKPDGHVGEIGEVV